MTAKKALAPVRASTVSKAGRGNRVRVTDILPIVEPCRGNISAIARALGASRQTVYRRIAQSPQLQAAIESAREARIDDAESQLDAAVDRGEPWAVSLLLRTLGRDRGYGDRAEVDLNTQVEVVIGFAAEEGDQ